MGTETLLFWKSSWQETGPLRAKNQHRSIELHPGLAIVNWKYEALISLHLNFTRLAKLDPYTGRIKSSERIHLANLTLSFILAQQPFKCKFLWRGYVPENTLLNNSLFTKTFLVKVYSLTLKSIVRLGMMRASYIVGSLWSSYEAKVLYTLWDIGFTFWDEKTQFRPKTSDFFNLKKS